MAYNYYYQVWDAFADTWGVDTLVGNISLPSGNLADCWEKRVLVVNNTIYILDCYLVVPSTIGGYYYNPSTLRIYLTKLPLNGALSTPIKLYELSTEIFNIGMGTYEYFPGVTMTSSEDLGTFARQNFLMIPDKFGVRIICWINTYGALVGEFGRSREYTLVGDESGLVETKIYDNPAGYRLSGVSRLTEQLTLTRGFVGGWSFTASEGYIFNGETFKFIDGADFVYPPPYYYLNANIFPVLSSHSNYYIARNPSDGTFHLINIASMEEASEIIPPTGTTFIKPMSSALHLYEDQIYFICERSVDFETMFIPYDLHSFSVTDALIPGIGTASYGTRGINYGGFFIFSPATYSIANPLAIVCYIDMGIPYYSSSGIYRLLQRVGGEYNLIQESWKPIRIDVSNNSPVLSLQDYEYTFQSNFFYPSGLVQTTPDNSIYSRLVQDYRYALLGEVISGIVTSGVSVMNRAIYNAGSGIYWADLETYSGSFILFDTPSSGLLGRIETTNFVYPEQYIFTTTLGDNPQFYQRDNDGMFFDEYSGLPSSRVTMIRVDDRL